MGDVYVMFYFSAFNPTRAYKAFNTFAVSRDLVHWTDWTGPDLITPSKSYDEAVRPQELRDFAWRHRLSFLLRREQCRATRHRPCHQPSDG